MFQSLWHKIIKEHEQRNIISKNKRRRGNSHVSDDTAMRTGESTAGEHAVVNEHCSNVSDAKRIVERDVVQSEQFSGSSTTVGYAYDEDDSDEKATKPSAERDAQNIGGRARRTGGSAVDKAMRAFCLVNFGRFGRRRYQRTTIGIDGGRYTNGNDREPRGSVTKNYEYTDGGVERALSNAGRRFDEFFSIRHRNGDSDAGEHASERVPRVSDNTNVVVDDCQSDDGRHEQNSVYFNVGDVHGRRNGSVDSIFDDEPAVSDYSDDERGRHDASHVGLRGLAHALYMENVGSSRKYVSEVCIPADHEQSARLINELQTMAGRSNVRIFRVVSVHNEHHVHVAHACSQANKTCRCAWLQGVEYSTTRRTQYRRRVFIGNFTVDDWHRILRTYKRLPNVC